MTIINQKSRLYWRLGFLSMTIPSALIGFAGMRHTSEYLNRNRQASLSHEQRIEQLRAEEQARIAQKLAEAEGLQAEAEAYSELGLRQASCGDTLSQFYFQPGVPVQDQLNLWGFDWNAPRYSTQNWYPLFDSNNLLFAAIRQGEIVQSDQVPMDQASICNENTLN
jgi:multidrug efflux pump subunit AcrA (membrane-fusion protein)